MISYFNCVVFAEHRVRVANEIGAGNAKGARFASFVSVLTSLVVGLFFWSMILAFHDTLAMIFTSSSSVIAIVNELAELLAFTILLNCIQPVLSGEIRSILFLQSHMQVSWYPFVSKSLSRSCSWIWMASNCGIYKHR